jgi:hypothetical protein
MLQHCSYFVITMQPIELDSRAQEKEAQLVLGFLTAGFSGVVGLLGGGHFFDQKAVMGAREAA